MAKANTEDTLFSAAGDVKFPYFKWEKPGDRVKGVYVGKFSSISAKYGHTQENYVLIQDDGSKILVAGRNPKSKEDATKIIYGMDKIPMGAIMGFLYTGDKATTKGNPCKLIEPKYLGEKDMATYESFKNMYNLDEVKEVAGDESPEVIDEL